MSISVCPYDAVGCKRRNPWHFKMHTHPTIVARQNLTLSREDCLAQLVEIGSLTPSGAATVLDTVHGVFCVALFVATNPGDENVQFCFPGGLPRVKPSAGAGA